MIDSYLESQLLSCYRGWTGTDANDLPESLRAIGNEYTSWLYGLGGAHASRQIAALFFTIWLAGEGDA